MVACFVGRDGAHATRGGSAKRTLVSASTGKAARRAASTNSSGGGPVRRFLRQRSSSTLVVVVAVGSAYYWYYRASVEQQNRFALWAGAAGLIASVLQPLAKAGIVRESASPHSLPALRCGL